MPSNIPATTIRIEPEVKKEATAILDELGLSMSSAVNMFLRAMIREGGLPFEMKVAPKELAASVNIADRERVGTSELHPKTWTASIKTTPLGTGSGTPPGSVPSV